MSQIWPHVDPHYPTAFLPIQTSAKEEKHQNTCQIFLTSFHDHSTVCATLALKNYSFSIKAVANVVHNINKQVDPSLKHRDDK